jgi:hypothetical protein
VLIGVVVVGVAFLAMLLRLIASLLFRRRFQFGVRTLLVLTVAVAVPCSWLGMQMRKAREQREAVERMRALPVFIWCDHQADDRLAAMGLPYPALLRTFFGNDFFADVVGLGVPHDSHVTDGEVEQLSEFIRLQKLDLESPPYNRHHIGSYQDPSRPRIATARFFAGDRRWVGKPHRNGLSEMA